jgi:hypothetical protein
MSAPINNIFGRDGFFWWMGVVEDREDPLFLGRCRVRIFGYHIDNKDLLPTRDLPWAIPLQPVTSAATSGVGGSPVGPVTGTWVMGFFADGKDCQQPVIMGTMAGFRLPTEACTANNAQEDLYAPDTKRDVSGNPMTDEAGRPIKIIQNSSNSVVTVPTNNTGPVITVVGDSLAAGTGAALSNLKAGVTVVATVGINTKRILQDITRQTNAHNPRFAVLSGGGNDLADVVADTPTGLSAAKNRIDAVKANAKQIRTVVNAGAAVVWLLSRNRIAAEAIRQVAAEYGDQVIDTLNYASADGIHPKDYNAVARDVIKILDRQGAGVDAPQRRDSGNLSNNIIPSPYVLRDLPPLNKSDVQLLMNGIGFPESDSLPGRQQNYASQNLQYFIGKYQFGGQALTQLGYVKWAQPPLNGARGKVYSEYVVATTPSVWASKNGLKSAEDFKANGPLQEQIMFAFLEDNYNFLLQRGHITPTMDKRQAAGILQAAHLAGAPGTSAWLNSNKGGLKPGPTDANKSTPLAYYAIGYATMNEGGRQYYRVDDYLKGRLSYTTPTGRNVLERAPNNGVQAPPNADPAGPLNDPRVGNEPGFNDPNSVYPTCDYADHPDTNKLATGQDIVSTIVQHKVDTAIDEIPVATVGLIGSGLAEAQLAEFILPNRWAQIATGYNARYPYNKVFATEAGHVVEFDDTPEWERFHLYHPSGTFIEIHPDGTVQYRTEGDDQHVILANKRVYVRGQYDLTVEGAHNVLVQSAYNVQVKGNATINVHNSCNINTGGDFTVNANGDFKVRAKNMVFEAVPTLDVNVVPDADDAVTDLTGNPPLLKPGNITFYAFGDYRLTGLGSYDLFVALDVSNYCLGQISNTAIAGINLYSPNQIAADAGLVYWQMGIGLANAAAFPPAVSPLTGLKPSIPTIEQLIENGIDYVFQKVGDLADAASAHGQSENLDAVADVEIDARNIRGGSAGKGKTFADQAADNDIRSQGFKEFDPKQPFAIQGRGVDASDLTNMKDGIKETAKVSKKWKIGNFLTKSQLAFLTTTVVVGLTPAGDRNLSIGEKLGLGAVLAGSRALLSTAGASNTQKIIGTLGANLATTRLRGEKGYPLGLGFTVLAKSLPAFVDIGLDTYSKGNPNLTADQRRNLGWIGVGAAAVSAAASNPNINSKNFAQQVGLNVLGAGYTYSVNTGILSTGTQRYLGQVGVVLASNALRGDDEANKRLLRNLGGAALGSVVDRAITRTLNYAYGLAADAQASGITVLGRTLGQVVRNEIAGRRDLNRRLIGYAAGSYISDLVYNNIVDSYGGSSAALAAQTAGLLGGFSRNLIIDGSLTSDNIAGRSGRRGNYQGGSNSSTGGDGRRLSSAQIATNIKALAVNTMDPIADRYPDVKILVGYLDGHEGQHGTGQAVDIHFPKRPNKDYYEIARWIRDNVAFDQLLLETEILQGVQRFWIHISFSLDGNRPPEGVFQKGKVGPKVGTVVGGKLYRPFLVQLAQGYT